MQPITDNISLMLIPELHIGMKVRHPAYGVGEIVTVTEQTADICFEDGARRTVSPEGSALSPAEPVASVEGLTLPLKDFIQKTVRSVVDTLELERPASVLHGLGQRWHGGTLRLSPADTSLQSKELPLETFFHKIVMVRNQLRVLEQKINAHDLLSDADKVELQAYITRCYGSMTTFNILFKEKEEGF